MVNYCIRAKLTHTEAASRGLQSGVSVSAEEDRPAGLIVKAKLWLETRLKTEARQQRARSERPLLLLAQQLFIRVEELLIQTVGKTSAISTWSVCSVYQKCPPFVSEEQRK